jgi:hypothetical protein
MRDKHYTQHCKIFLPPIHPYQYNVPTTSGTPQSRWIEIQ